MVFHFWHSKRLAFFYLWLILGLIWPIRPSLAWAKPGKGQIVVIFTANLSGAWTDCGCDANSGGGVVRISAAIDSLRRLYPQALVVDAGDFLSSFSRPGIDSLMLAAYSRMRYDAIGPGEYEFSLGPASLKRLSKWHLPIVAANVGHQSASRPFILIRKNRYKIGVVAVIDEQVFQFRGATQRPAGLEPWKNRLQQTLADGLSGADVIIGLVHGYADMVEQAAKVFPPGSLIVQGHWHRLYNASRDGKHRVAGRTLVNPGENGELIGLARWFPGKAHWEVSLIALDARARRDENLISAVRRQLQQ